MRSRRVRDIITPCETKCELVDDTCSHCGRTDTQIENWLRYSHDERVQIIKTIKREKKDGKGIRV